MRDIKFWIVLAAVSVVRGGWVGAAEPGPVPVSAHNLLIDAEISGNLASYDKGLRGKPEDVIYDPPGRRFLMTSIWHEYGVAAGADLGVVPEDQPAYWLAEWTQPIEANLIVLSGVYPNQPQPGTGWKIELRRDGRWMTHDRGTGGWYDSGRYVWGGRGAQPVSFDAIRVGVFSGDTATPLKSIHFRGEQGLSWVVARAAAIDARIQPPPMPIRAGRPVPFVGVPLAGDIDSWQWDLDAVGKRDGSVDGREVTHTFTRTGPHTVRLRIAGGGEAVTVQETVKVLPPIEGQIVALTAPVMVGTPVVLTGRVSLGTAKRFDWDFGDGQTAAGRSVTWTFDRPGVRRVKLAVSDGRYTHACESIIRVHTPETLHVPQVFLDTDQKNEVDDQHYFAYGLFSEVDVLGVNSIHHGGGQEAVNYAEILNILDLAQKSGLPLDRVPFVFRGADERLSVPENGDWRDTEPIVTAASEAIVAAVRGASPSNPVWVLPVGPATNTASAILQARAEGLVLPDRMKVMWLGGSDRELTRNFNGGNDPWAAYVMTQCGVETWLMPEPVSARILMDVRTEAELYPDNPLGQYLKQIVPRHSKSIYDPSCLAAVISLRLGLGWLKEVETVTVAGPEQGYRWTKTDGPTPVRVIRQIDQTAMKADLFDTLKGQPRRLIGAPYTWRQSPGGHR